MPWEERDFKISKLAAGEDVKHSYKLFQDHARPWISARVSRTHAERYLSMKSIDLQTIYKSEVSLTYKFHDRIYCLPMCMVISPPDVNPKSTASIRIEKISDPFSVDDCIGMYTTPLIEILESGKDKRLHNGKVASLRNIEQDEDGNWRFIVAEGSYFESLATNFAMDHRPERVKHSLREFLSASSNRLGDFKDSPLTNHIGVVCMVESSDGMLVVQRRSASVANRPKSLSSSVSGAIEWDDLTQEDLDIECLVKGMFRESFEEIGITPTSFRFLGLVREYLRGGKPEIYFFCKSDMKFSEIDKERNSARDRRESTGLLPFELHTNQLDGTDLAKQAFYDRIVDVLEAVGPNANLTLVAGICLIAEQYLVMSTKKMNGLGTGRHDDKKGLKTEKGAGIPLQQNLKEGNFSSFKGTRDLKKTVKKILVLSSNPKTTTRLRLDEEIREIKEGLQRSKYRDQFQIKSREALRLRDLRRALLDYEPHIVHFIGHGEKNGILVEDEVGFATRISSKALSGLFELCSEQIECVILGACYSERQANAISKYINYVVGMRRAIKDKAAIEFAVGFYDALGAGKSIETAFKFGRNAIRQAFPDISKHSIPILKKRKK